MDGQYNWPPQAYANGQYVPYISPQQPNSYPQNGYPPQYPPMGMQMQMPQSYPHVQQQPYENHARVGAPQQPGQQYAQMPPQMHAVQQLQMQQQQMQQQHHHQQQQQPRAQPRVVIPAPMQMQAPRIRHVQVPVQRTSSMGGAQMDGSADQRRSYGAQQSLTPPTSKAMQQTQSHQENRPRPQQRTMSTPGQNHSQHRAPLQPQSTPKQHTPSQSQTPSTQIRRPSIPQPSSKPKAHPQVVISRPSSHQLTPTKHVHVPQRALPADLSILLLSAADEYIAAARAMASLIVRDKRAADFQQYYKLMSTAMGCMGTVLKEFHLPPRDEAKLRLRYASLLVDETDNTSDIDDVLSKLISLCGRCRLQDLKYATFHLQARYQFKTSHRAALKSLEKPISEAETFQHIAWVYAFRFLKVSLILQIPGRVELVPAMQQLNAMVAHAEKRGDRAVYVACSALEAIVHLRSGAPDRLEHAQRAIAAARSLQLQVSAKELGLFGTLIDIIDVACGVQHGAPNTKKSTALIETMLDKSSNLPGSEDGAFTVLIERSFGGSLTMDTGGVFRKSSDARDELTFAWLPKEDLKTLCFYISALDQNVHEKGMSFAKEAHQRSRAALKRVSPYGLPISMAFAQIDWNRALDWHAMFTIGIIAVFREDQPVAKEALAILKKRARKFHFEDQGSCTRTLSYLTAINDQKNGFLDAALTAYSSDAFTLPEKGSASSAKTDIAILAGLNRFLIIRASAHPQYHAANALLAQLELLCENHANQYFKMAFRLIHAISSEHAAINRQKTLMQNASNRANELFRNTQNREFVIVALCFFTMRFFADQVGEKSIQAIRATRQNARLSRKPLWQAVAYGLCITTYQRNGLMDEAQKAHLDYDAVRPQLPLALQGEEDVDAEGEEDDE